MKSRKIRIGKDRRLREIKLPENFADRRRQAERRHPEIAEASLEEFELLMSAKTTQITDTAQDTGSGWDDLTRPS